MPDIQFRATVSPIRFAMDPPETSVPLASAGYPIISLSQLTTCLSVSASWAPRAFQLDVWKFQGRSSSIR
ncbi:hypothetical protein ACROSR_20105, partial [Roseovarius tibetensis]|uniref:hypothetical protein n=1 Tax=Roseovarius tibetensis TaxID=2685897 RepID=UPI003D7F2AEA